MAPTLLEIVPASSSLDKGISIVIIFFILSMISERFITFTKLYFTKGKALWLIIDKNEDLSSKSDNSEVEKIREMKILKVNISLSIIISLFANANFFNILSFDPPYNGIGWRFGTNPTFEWCTVHLTILGCILTGLFISLGSKFWHDLLDSLFYAKNLKDKLGQKATYEVENAQQLDTWLKITQADIVRKVFEDNKEMLKGIKNVISVGIGHDNNQKCIEVVTLEANSNLIPKSLFYNTESGQSTPVKVNVISASEIKIHFQPPTEITNITRNQSIGSYGLVVYLKSDLQKKPLLLSCYHVLKGKDHKYDGFEVLNEEEIVSPHGTNSIIGKLIYGIRNNTIDAAIMAPNGNVILSNSLPGNQKITGCREITVEEQYSEINVKIYGAVSTVKEGFIKSMYNYTEILYYSPSGTPEPWDMYNLIAITNSNGQCISIPGDSGAAVLDKDNKVIGLVIAGNDTTTYAIPINSVLDNLNLKILES